MATQAAWAEDKFSLPDLTVLPSKPVAAKPANPAPLTPPKSQWTADDPDKPAKSFGHISNGPCDGCKVSLRARQQPLYPNIGATPLFEPGDPPLSDDDQ